MSSSSLATYYREQPLPWLEACSRGTHSPLSPAPPSFVSSKSDPSLQLEQRRIPLRHTDPLPSLPQGKLVPTTGPLPWFLSRTFSGQLLSNPSGCSSKKPLWPQPPSRAPPACQHLCCPCFAFACLVLVIVEDSWFRLECQGMGMVFCSFFSS